MRKLALLPVSVLLVACMAIYASPFAPVAWAGEVLVGTIIVTDGGTASNRTTGWANYACASNTIGGCFLVSTGGKYTVQSDEGCLVLTDVAGCDAGQCLKLAANEKFPTSINSAKNLTGYAFNSDGGTAGHAVTFYGGWIAAAPPVGTATCNLRVYSRNGTE